VLIFSELHHVQNNQRIQQILVFPNQKVKNLFDHRFEEEVKAKGIEQASDTNLGAVYKLQTVKNNDGTYTGLILCGFTGDQLWKNKVDRDKSVYAFKVCVQQLNYFLCEDIQKFKQVLVPLHCY